MAISIYVAGRNSVESISRPARPGRIASSAFFDAARDVDRVGPREFFDDQHEAGLVVDDRVADERLMVFDDVGHVAEPLVGALDGDLGQFFGRGDRQTSAGRPAVDSACR